MASTESDVEHIYVSQCCGTIIIKKHRGYQKQENVGRYVSEHHGLYETDLISQGRGQDSRYAGKYIRTEQLIFSWWELFCQPVVAIMSLFVTIAPSTASRRPQVFENQNTITVCMTRPPAKASFKKQRRVT